MYLSVYCLEDLRVKYTFCLCYKLCDFLVSMSVAMCMFKDEKGKTKRIKIIVEQDHGRRGVWLLCTKFGSLHSARVQPLINAYVYMYFTNILRGCVDVIMNGYGNICVST